MGLHGGGGEYPPSALWGLATWPGAPCRRSPGVRVSAWGLPPEGWGRAVEQGSGWGELRRRERPSWSLIVLAVDLLWTRRSSGYKLETAFLENRCRQAQRGGVVRQWGKGRCLRCKCPEWPQNRRWSRLDQPWTAATHAESTLQKWGCSGGSPSFHFGPLFPPWALGPPSLPLLSLFLFPISSFSPLLISHSFLSREILGQHQPSPAESCQSLQLWAFILVSKWSRFSSN